MSLIRQRHDADDATSFRTAFGRFATGVSVATCAPSDGAPVGITINALASVSLDPALALFCLEERSATLSSFLRAGHFALNVLAEDQADLSSRFATEHAFDTQDAPETWGSGAPVLTRSLAVADCMLMDSYGGGDHVILLGKVLEVGWRDDAGPLVYYSGKYGRMVEA